METLGTPDEDLQKYLIEQVVKTFNIESFDEWGDNAVLTVNNALAMLAGIQPLKYEKLTAGIACIFQGQKTPKKS